MVVERFGNAIENRTQLIVKRYHRLPEMVAFAGRDGDGVFFRRGSTAVE